MRQFKSINRRHKSEEPGSGIGRSHSNTTADCRKHQPFHEELEQDACSSSTQGLAQTDFARALRNRDQHNVDHSHGPKSECHQPDSSEEGIHGVGNFADHLGVGDGIPIIECVRSLRIEIVISGNNSADGFPSLRMLRARNRLIDEILDRLRVAFSLQREIRCHGGEWHNQPHIQVGIVAVADFLDGPNHLEGHAIDQESAPDDWPSGKKDADEFAADDTDIVALQFVVPIQPAALFDGLIADVIELWLGPIHVAVAAAVLAHQAKVATVDNGRRIPNIWGTANVEIVLVGQIVLARRKLATANGRDAAVVHLH